jgi:hypothetical protein
VNQKGLSQYENLVVLRRNVTIINEGVPAYFSESITAKLLREWLAGFLVCGEEVRFKAHGCRNDLLENPREPLDTVRLLYLRPCEVC